EVPLHKQEHSLESSLTIAKKKTAALFRLSAFSAAHLCGAGAASAAKMSEFGEKLGIAFQILDDILDVTSDEDLLGKKSGLDLIERKPSVVNVLWLASGSPLSKRLRSAPDDQDELFAKQALAELRPGKVVQEARALALRFVDEAAQALSEAAKLAPRVDEAALEDLRALIAYTTERVE
ncbi:MAG: polyprenyl synthetase family protein, partial [Deltaproteobacteria bacterium]|nr:polyprenyl synthetase family protein [Deltaproteobacteria bacterium]